MKPEEEKIYADLKKTKANAEGEKLLEMYWNSYWRYLVGEAMKEEEEL